MRLFEAGSLARTGLVVFTCASGFTTGALFTLGHGMIALVDKTHLLLLLAFYGSVASFVVHVAISIYAVGLSQRHAMFAARKPIAKFINRFRRQRTYAAKRRVVRNFKRDATYPRSMTIIYFIGISVPVAAVLAIFIFKNWDHIQRMRSIGDLIDGIIVLGFVIVGLTAAVWSMPDKLGQLRSRLFGYVAAFAAFFALIASYQLGGYWVRYLQVLGPRVSLYVESAEKPVIASIAFAANDGLIFFVEGTEYPVQYPWSSIDRIEGEKVAKSMSLLQ